MELKLDHNSSVPLHRQAEDLLRKLILSEEYKNGKLLPKEVDMASKMDISRNTLRQAINKLVFEGLLVRRKGYGTMVAAKRVMSNARNWMSFSQEMQSLGITIKNFELHLSHQDPPEEAREFFGISGNRKLLCIERLRGKTEQPFVFFVSYFNPAIGMSVEEDMSKPLYEILEKSYGIVVKTSREHISAQSADRKMAARLDIAEGDPILVRRRYVLDTQGEPVEYNVGYYRADSFTYSIEFTNE